MGRCARAHTHTRTHCDTHKTKTRAEGRAQQTHSLAAGPQAQQDSEKTRAQHLKFINANERQLDSQRLGFEAQVGPRRSKMGHRNPPPPPRDGAFPSAPVLSWLRRPRAQARAARKGQDRHSRGRRRRERRRRPRRAASRGTPARGRRAGKCAPGRLPCGSAGAHAGARARAQARVYVRLGAPDWIESVRTRGPASEAHTHPLASTSARAARAHP